MAFDLNDTYILNALQVGDALEMDHGGYKTVLIMTEKDFTWKGKRDLHKAFKSGMLSGASTRVGKLEELEDFVMAHDHETVYTLPDASKGDKGKIYTNLYGGVPVESARALKADDPERKFYQFI